MKKLLYVLLIAFILVPVKGHAASHENNNWYESTEVLIDEQLDNINTSEWSPFLKYVKEEGIALLEDESAHDVIRRLISGEFTFSLQDLLNNLIRIFFSEFNLNLGLMVKIMVISIICGIFRNMNDSFNNPSVGEIGYFVCYSLVMILIIQSFFSILSLGKTSIDNMSGFMQLLFPVLLGLLTSIGSFASASIMHPTIGMVVGTVGSVLTNLVFPLITLSAVITLINHISNRIQIKKLGKLFNNLCTWILAFIFTVFISVLAIQGALTASFDGISIRTAKFAVDTFVPIVGKMFSQSLDTIVGCALLVKNAVGAAGLIIITLICFAPAIKIFSLLFLYKLTGALLEPITDKRIVESLNEIGSVLSILLITVLGSALMFFITITLMIATGNTAVMLR